MDTLLRKFSRFATTSVLATSVSITSALSPLSLVSAQETAPEKPTDTLIKVIELASGEGMFIGREEYKELRDSVLSLDDALAQEALTPEQAQRVGDVLNKVDQQKAAWLSRLIESIKTLRTNQGAGVLPSVDLERLAKVCGGNLNSEQAQIVIQAISDLANGASLTDDQQTQINDYKGATQDCDREIVSFIAEITNYTERLETELAELQKRIDSKQRQCDGLSAGDEKSQCEADLKVLNDELKEKKEKYREAKEVEKSGRDLKILLAVLSLAAGVVALYYGDINTAAAAFAFADQMFKEANEEEIEELERERADGMERDTSGATTATEEQVEQLNQKAATDGLTPVTYTNSETGASVSIFQKVGHIQVYLTVVRLPDGTEGPRLIADLTDANTVVLPNDKGIARLSDITLSAISGSIFGNRKAVEMSGDAVNVNGNGLKISIAERSVGQREYTVTINQ